MQLVQPSKFFSVTIFRTRSIGSIGMHTYMRTWAMLLFLVTVKNLMSAQLPWELHALFCNITVQRIELCIFWCFCFVLYVFPEPQVQGH